MAHQDEQAYNELGSLKSLCHRNVDGDVFPANTAFNVDEWIHVKRRSRRDGAQERMHIPSTCRTASAAIQFRSKPLQSRFGDSERRFSGRSGCKGTSGLPAWGLSAQSSKRPCTGENRPGVNLNSCANVARALFDIFNQLKAKCLA